MKIRLPISALAGMLLWVSCQAPPAQSASAGAQTSQGSMGARLDVHRNDGPARDLTQDEAAGGHVLSKHVGRSDEDLRDRLRRERHISGASTYTDRATAEQVIGNAIAYNKDRIQRWLSRPGGHPNLVLDYDADQPIGRTMNRGDSQSRPCSHALVVLKYADANYYVLTSYPECR